MYFASTSSILWTSSLLYAKRDAIDCSIPAGVLIIASMGSWPLIYSLMDLRSMKRNDDVSLASCISDIDAGGAEFLFDNQSASAMMHESIKDGYNSEYFVCCSSCRSVIKSSLIL